MRKYVDATTRFFPALSLMIFFRIAEGADDRTSDDRLGSRDNVVELFFYKNLMWRRDRGVTTSVEGAGAAGSAPFRACL
jgi:hypothetical protein